MLERISSMPFGTMNVIVYTNSTLLQGFIKDSLKARFEIKRNTTVSVLSDKELKEAIDETTIPPFGGGVWMVDIIADDIKVGEIAKAINKSTQSSIKVFWISKYQHYKKILELDAIKKQGSYCSNLYLGRLDSIDIQFLHEKIVPEKQRLTKELLNYVKKNYTYDVQSVCDLFVKLKQGDTVKSTKDIIAKIGIGGNTVDSFVIKLLTSNPKTEKGLKSAVGKNLTLLQDLNFSYKYQSIRNFMISTVSTILDIKQLQIQGKYAKYRKEIPEEGYNEQKIQRLKRYENAILEDINMARVLNLKICLEAYNNYDTHLSLLQSIIEFLNGVKESNEKNPESTEMSVKRRSRK